ncbi:hypothetical protein PV325_012128 [Microctonus aethiopoides]|uniref:Protein bric-a-brac 2 n=1 Tax=Microctonus aethiopoides TaxID=144406 RepID=A0AA39ET35_9HYME|nr:hypothetical protein PV325_012128 [Microctonus aethiopoides]KAK0157337.1 hypothetical protein PV328_011091 [Microctonus aethiopoides]
MEGQQFCLRWHNFQNTLLSALPKLLDGGYLTDVTLSAGGRHIQAHRIILSACSFYFKELFKDLSALQHPVIVLPGMEYANLCALVTFMYNGEVNIYQEQLPALLAMADTLHIRGLADIAGNTTAATASMPITHHDNSLSFINQSRTCGKMDVFNEESITIKEEKISDSKLITGAAGTTMMNKTGFHEAISTKNEIVDDAPLIDEAEEIPCGVKTKPYYSINAKLAKREKKQTNSVTPQLNKQTEKNIITGNNSIIDDITLVHEQQNFTLDGNFDGKMSTMIDTNYHLLNSNIANTGRSGNNSACNKTSVTCLICGKQLSNQYNLRVHMETHSNSSYSCSACSHVSRSRDALRKHVSYRHPVTSPQKRPRYSLTKP